MAATRLLLMCFAGIALLSAQESQTVIDNDQVKVLKVLVQPHEKTRLHQHKVNRVMIYLQPGSQTLDYQDGRRTVLTWRAGEPRWSPAGGMHVAELITSQPVTIVEVELKKPASAASFSPNPLDPVRVDPGHYKVEFENSQVRVLRVKLGAGASAPLHRHQFNRVVVYLTGQELDVTSEDGKTVRTVRHPGDVAWAGPTTHKERNVASEPFEVIVVEVKG